MSAPKFKSFNCELARTVELASANDDGLTDVAVMSCGPARGHGMRVDEKTLSQFMTHALGKSMSSYLTHRGAVEATADGGEKPGDRLGQEIGIFSGFYRDGDTVRAKNFRFLEAFKKDEPKLHARIVELAQIAADQLGISPVVAYIRAWVRNDGSEVPEGSGNGIPADLSDPLPAMRIRRLFSLDFVKSPATNVGLFDEAEDETTKEKQHMDDKVATLTEQLSAKSAEIVTLTTAHQSAVATLKQQHSTEIAALNVKITELSNSGSGIATKIASLESENGTLKTQLADAKTHDMRLAGAPALTAMLQSKGGSPTDNDLPVPAGTAQGRWEQYATLCEEVKDAKGNVVDHKDTKKSVEFRKLHLSGKHS